MVKLDKTYVIGTHVMWFEIEMYSDFIDGMAKISAGKKRHALIVVC